MHRGINDYKLMVIDRALDGHTFYIQYGALFSKEIKRGKDNHVVNFVPNNRSYPNDAPIEISPQEAIKFIEERWG